MEKALQEKIENYLPTSDSEYALPFAVISSKDFSSFSKIKTPVLPIEKTLITDYAEKNQTALDVKINEIINNVLREEYNRFKDLITEEQFFQEINALVDKILLGFYEAALDDDSYQPDDEELMDDSIIGDAEPVKFYLSSVEVTGDILLLLEEMHEYKYSY